MAKRLALLIVAALLVQPGAGTGFQDAWEQLPSSIGGPADPAGFVSSADSGTGRGQGLLDSIKGGNIALVEKLLLRRADTEVKDEFGDTPLAIAAKNGSQVVVDLLLKARASTEHETVAGRTPLYDAAEAGHEAVVGLLLEGRASTEKAVTGGTTPLIVAVDRDYEAVTDLLLKARANIESTDDEYKSPLRWALDGGNEGMVLHLVEAKANIEAKDHDGFAPLDLMNYGLAVKCCQNISELCVDRLITAAAGKHMFFGGLLLGACLYSTGLEVGSGVLRALPQEVSRTLQKGVMTDGLLAFLEHESGTEAMLSLLVSVYALPFTARTPWQMVFGALSICLSVWSMAGFQHGYFDLRLPRPESSESQEEAASGDDEHSEEGSSEDSEASARSESMATRRGTIASGCTVA